MGDLQLRLPRPAQAVTGMPPRSMTGLERIAMAVLGVLISGSIVGGTAMLIRMLEAQSVQHEQMVGVRAAVRRLEKQLEHVQAQLGQMVQRTQGQRALEAQRKAIDHNWDVIERLRVRLQTVEHTLWPPGRAGWRPRREPEEITE